VWARYELPDRHHEVRVLAVFHARNIFRTITLQISMGLSRRISQFEFIKEMEVKNRIVIAVLSVLAFAELASAQTTEPPR